MVLVSAVLTINLKYFIRLAPEESNEENLNDKSKRT